MAESSEPLYQNEPAITDLNFGHEIEIEDGGFSFHPMEGFELEIDGSVYMYSESGNLEIYMLGGDLDEKVSITKLNDDLSAEFLENVDDFNLVSAGMDSIQEISGFVNEIHFNNAEEEGSGRALICSPHVNQFFYILAIANAEYWESQGSQVFNALKSQVRFQPLFKPEILETETRQHPDLTIETNQSISPGEEFVVNIEKGDVSLLLAARAQTVEENISITRIVAPDEKELYRYNPLAGDFSGSVWEEPLTGEHGEVCMFLPRTSQQSLLPGDYRFTFATDTGTDVQEIQFIIRSGRALDLQKFDLNFWLAVENESLFNPDAVEQFETDLYQTLRQRLAPLNLAPGRISFIHPAPDELASFSSINLVTDLADCSYMILESIIHERALNIGLVDHILQNTPSGNIEVKAVSSGSPGMIMTQDSPHACILIQWPGLETDIHSLVDLILQQLIVFSGIDVRDTQQQADTSSFALNKEIAWRLRRHPIFYDAD